MLQLSRLTKLRHLAANSAFIGFANTIISKLPGMSLYLQVFAALHQIFDIIDCREEEIEDLEELMFLLR